MGKRAGLEKRKEKGWRAAFLAQIPGRNGWSMQSGVTEGKGSRGWKGGLVMTRHLFVALSFSPSPPLSLSKSGNVPLSSLTKADPFLGHSQVYSTCQSGREGWGRRGGEEGGESGLSTMVMGVDYNLMYRSRTVASNDYDCTWDELPCNRSQKTFSAAKPATPTKRAQKGGEKQGSRLDR